MKVSQSYLYRMYVSARVFQQDIYWDSGRSFLISISQCDLRWPLLSLALFSMLENIKRTGQSFMRGVVGWEGTSPTTDTSNKKQACCLDRCPLFMWIDGPSGLASSLAKWRLKKPARVTQSIHPNHNVEGLTMRGHINPLYSPPNLTLPQAPLQKNIGFFFLLFFFDHHRLSPLHSIYIWWFSRGPG